LKNLYVGIDPGTSTGLAVWDAQQKEFYLLTTATITEAMKAVLGLRERVAAIYIEDARQRTWFGNSGRERLKGAGSVERDCSIWQQFCTEEDLPFYLVHPKNNRTKLEAPQFKKLTGYAGRTSVHCRDAAMLVFGR
jgi:hypothetical protein